MPPFDPVAQGSVPCSDNATIPVPAPQWQREVNREIGNLNHRAPRVLTNVGGTANAITADCEPAVTSLVEGDTFWLTPIADNTAAPTITIGSASPVDGVDEDGDPAPAGTVVTGRLYLLHFDGSDLRIYAAGASGNGSITAPDLIVEDQKAANTDGGSATSGSFATRTLNTAVRNELPGASLSGSQVTLPPGTYLIQYGAPALGVEGHKARLRNVTDGSDVHIGETAKSDADALYANTWSRGLAVVTITTSKAFEVQHRVESSRVTSGFGEAANVGETEKYSYMWVWRVGPTDAQIYGIPGGAGTFRLEFDAGTGGGDPGPSQCAFDNAAVASITKLYVDDTDYALQNIIAALQAMFTSSSQTKARIRLEKRGDATKWVAASVSVMTDQSGYTEFTLTSPTGSAASVPFSGGDIVDLLITPTGDAGTAGGVRFAHSTTTTAADPGVGIWRASSTTFASITALYVDNEQNGGGSVTAFLDALDDHGNSTLRGILRGENIADPTEWAEFNVTGNVVDSTGFRTISVTPRAEQGWPFANASITGFTFYPAGSPGAPSYREVTSAGDITVAGGDDIIGVNKASGAATNINLGLASARSGKPITVKDIKGDAASNNITFVFSGGELVDGMASLVIATNYGWFTLYPRTGGWYLAAS